MHGAKERLSAAAQSLLVDPENALFLSSASVWELAIKARLGKLTLPQPPDRFVIERLSASQVTSPPMRHDHALRAADLPPHHRDPFDRMLVAQTVLENLVLMTGDSKIERYDVNVVKA
jgi:PIN domain nuclease of toxin-antitoxin system